MEHKTYGMNHELGYSADEIKLAVNYIFSVYDKNKDNLLDQSEVKLLIEGSLLHMGNNHNPSEL